MKHTILIVLSAMLSSCIGTDIGGTLHDMGLSEPKTLPSGDVPEGDHFYPYTVELYQLNGEHYVEAPIVYVPQQGIWIECYCPLNNRNAMCTYRTPTTYTEMKALPVQYHYFHIKTFKYNELKSLRNAPHREFQTQQWIASRDISHVKDFDKIQAKHLGKLKLDDRTAHELAMKLPVQRTWYNHALRPLAYVGRVIDTASIFTIGTITFPIIAGLNPECLSPNHDITGCHRDE